MIWYYFWWFVYFVLNFSSVFISYLASYWFKIIYLSPDLTYLIQPCVQQCSWWIESVWWNRYSLLSFWLTWLSLDVGFPPFQLFQPGSMLYNQYQHNKLTTFFLLIRLFNSLFSLYFFKGHEISSFKCEMVAWRI